MKPRKRIELGEYIVADPEICGGELTFKGTRIFVKDVLEMLADGYQWDRISWEFDGRLNQAAISEAIRWAVKFGACAITGLDFNHPPTAVGGIRGK